MHCGRWNLLRYIFIGEADDGMEWNGMGIPHAGCLHCLHCLDRADISTIDAHRHRSHSDSDTCFISNDFSVLNNTNANSFNGVQVCTMLLANRSCILLEMDQMLL